MADINLLPLQQQFIKLEAKFERMDQDLTTLRERVEEVWILTQRGMDDLRTHVDERFAGLDEKLTLDREATDAGFNSVLRAIQELAARP